MDDIRAQILSAFQVEHKEQVDKIRAILSTLGESGAARDDPRWEEAFRMAHTLKGGARVCDLPGVEALGHRMESLFAAVREGSLDYSGDVGATIGRALDTVEDWMARFTSGQTPPTPQDMLHEIERLIDAAKRRAPVQKEVPAAPAPTTTDQPATPGVAAPPSETLRVQAHHLDHVLRSTDALLTASADQEHAVREFDRLSAEVRGLRRACASIRAVAAPVLRQLSAEPRYAAIARHVESVSQIAQRMSRLQRAASAAQRHGAWSLRVVSDDIRRAARQARMAPAEHVLAGLAPMVRNLARDLEREVEFTAEGMNVQADRLVLQALKDPLVHVLRNAVVHGIESPTDRVAQGKEPAGRVMLALRTAGNRLHVTVEDDGRGIDLDRVAAKTATTDREQLLRTLFRPGFTTCDTVTELAGRGMGLSIVHEAAARLRGSARLVPREQGGTRLEIVVPLMVSTERLLLVRAAEQTYALPVHTVERLLRVPADRVQQVENRQVVIADDRPVPLVRLTDALGTGGPTRADMLCVAVVRQGSSPVGLVVDEFVGERESLVKTLDEPASLVPHFTGAIATEGGAAVLVIDPAGLDDTCIAPARNDTPRSEQEQATQSPTVLIVDDSFTTRTLEKSILEANGYDVRVAVDGVEALGVLRCEPIGLVIADVQMPRMDGLTLLKTVRADPKFATLPLVLVTSLDRDEDRQRGLDYGADAYIVKRKFDHQELLTTIRRFM